MVSVLVVEDEMSLARTLETGLRDLGFTVTVEHDGSAGYRTAKGADFDLIVLDWMLPGMSGVEMCRRLRSEDVVTRILMLTARIGIADESEALQVGADDYVRKPFAFSILEARCNALLRRPVATTWPELSVGDLVLDVRRRQVRRGAVRIDLSRRETALLEYLLRAEGATRSKEEILRDVWGDTERKNPNLVEVYITYLRTKLDAPFDANLLRTVRGKGYRLDTS
ncbi:MAG: response regulator transcription factor [Aeromicrobium sp.]